ncbi:MAG: CAP domain-containing protein [Myxococcota bacterium]|nr:CAP domain-containing protein [Myxococcota bacterium]
MNLWILLCSSVAQGGYGDAKDGYPSWDERVMHTWTNAARMAPADFESEYNTGGCSFDDFLSGEQEGLPPLRWNSSLNEAARAHSEDMHANDWFDHDSSDGTSFSDRVWSYYGGDLVGENIAYGYDDEQDVVLVGWMCSPGHRSNIMESAFEELGTGVKGTYYTQDFGARGVSPRRLSMAHHKPRNPSNKVTFYADYYHDGGKAPDLMLVVLDEEELEMELEYGTEDMGIYKVRTDAGTGCRLYHVETTVGNNSTRFPAEGRYGWGECDFDDEDANWMSADEDAEPEDSGDDTEANSGNDDTGSSDDTGGDTAGSGLDGTDSSATGGCGCGSTQDRSGRWVGTGWLLGLLLMVARRREAGIAGPIRQ